MGKVASIAIAGIVSGLAYLAAQAVDIAATGNNTDDRLLAGGLVPVDRSDSVVTGTAMHLVNSLAFSAAFRLVGRDLLAGPMWLRGLLFALIETVALYPMAMFERLHPAIRDGRLPTYRTPVAFAQQVWRHAALGVVLGLLTPKRD
jgi:hypothetical protein